MSKEQMSRGLEFLQTDNTFPSFSVSSLGLIPQSISERPIKSQDKVLYRMTRHRN